jgi:hypothetical protein
MRNGKSSLELKIHQFLHENVGSTNLTISDAAVLHFHLVGSAVPILEIGFIRFLRNMGVPFLGSRICRW